MPSTTPGPIRWRRAAFAAGTAVLALGTAASPGTAQESRSTDDGSLPTVVNAPGTWSDDEGPTGRLAAIGISQRTRPEGITGARMSDELFGVSAADGRSTWIELPGVDTEQRTLIGWFALSPDGRYIGWSRERKIPPRGDDGFQDGLGEIGEQDLDLAPEIVGWSVMDTTTGRVRRLAPPTRGPIHGTLADLAFSGDSQHLLATYTDDPDREQQHFVALDVTTGAATTLEGPGHYWLPSIGSAADGIVWARHDKVYRQDLSTGTVATHVLTDSVVTASWSPSETSFAYISQPDTEGGPWVLHTGASPEAARDHTVRLRSQPGELLGWRDDQHVVVGHFRSTVQVVDIRSGAADDIDLDGGGEVVNTPLLASDLWQRPLRDPVARTGTTDPRRPFRWAGWTLVVATAGGLLVRRRYRRGRPHMDRSANS